MGRTIGKVSGVGRGLGRAASLGAVGLGAPWAQRAGSSRTSAYFRLMRSSFLRHGA